MNKDDIIRLVQEAGGRIEHIGTNIAWFEFLIKNLERFAALVAAAEREACAKVCEEGWKDGIGAKYQGDVFAEAIRTRGQK